MSGRSAISLGNPDVFAYVARRLAEEILLSSKLAVEGVKRARFRVKPCHCQSLTEFPGWENGLDDPAKN